MIIAEIIFAIVLAVSIVAGILGSKYLSILRERQHRAGPMERDLAERLAKVESLEKRVAVLEQIVTDKRYNLHEQFSKLEKAG